MTRNVSGLCMSPYSLLRHSGMPFASFYPHQLTLDSNFEALSPWEQSGDGTKPRRPEELKPLPPPKPEEVKN